MQTVQEIDIYDVEMLNRNIGHHWFSPSTKRFFRSRNSQTAFVGPGGRFFVSSEQFSPSSPRLYTVRQQRDDGSIHTVGQFQGYASRGVAVRSAKALAAKAVAHA